MYGSFWAIHIQQGLISYIWDCLLKLTMIQLWTIIKLMETLVSIIIIIHWHMYNYFYTTYTYTYNTGHHVINSNLKNVVIE